MSTSEVSASSVADFINSVGINVNIYPSTSGSLVSQLDYLGLDQVRAEAPTSASAAGTFAAIGAAGIRFDLITTCWELPITPSLLNTMFGYIDTVSPYVQSVEGPNEVQNDPDTYQGLAGQAEWTALQTTLYQMVQNDPHLTNAQKSTDVLSFSNVPGGNFTSPLTATNAASVHAYGQPGILPYDVVNPTLGVTTIAPGKPIIVTESGQTTVPTAQGVSGQEQALYDTDLFLDDYVIGVSKTYLFNLQDFNSSPTDTDFSGWYGLYNSDGSIKPAGTAIHNLTTILADPNASAGQTTGALAYTLTGLPDDGHQLLLEKSNGTFDLALWAENNGLYNTATRTLNAEPSSPVTLSFGGDVHDVSVFDPITGSSAIETLSAAGSLTLSLGADPLIVQISPQAPSAPATSASGSTPAAPAFPTLTVGAGADQVALQVSEDQSGGDVLFTVSIDGTQIGGTLTTAAIHAAGQDQTVDILGNFAPGEHIVSVDFLNDNGGRNLYVDSTSANGTVVGGGSHALYWDGSVGTAFDQPYPVARPPTVAAPAPVTPPIAQPAQPVLTIGAGQDVLALQVCEDAFQGDAQFTVMVDGYQVGGTLTATASRALGTTQTVDVLGNFSGGTHTASVDFLNDLSQLGVGDRNLYVTGATIDGVAVPGSSETLLNTGGKQFSFTSANPGALTVGSGNDDLSLQVSEDAYQGDAAFTVSVDGSQVGGTLTTTALHDLGQNQTVNVLGSFAAGPHTVAVTFLNDLYAGTPTTDRNLYVDGGSIDGSQLAGIAHTLLSDGSQSSTFTAEPIGTQTVGSGSDVLALQVAEDAYQGDAQFTVSVDGTQVGGVLTATALHDVGQNQTVDVLGNFAAGQHSVSVDFLNDDYKAYSGDRNLYVDGASLDGTAVAGSALKLFSAGAKSLSFIAPSNSSATAALPTLSAGSGALALQLGVSENAYQGDAMFTVAIDGKEVGGTLTATANHTVGQSQLVDVLGALTPGDHTLTLDFLNDAYSGVPGGGDRNLYLDHVTGPSTTFAGSSLALLGDGPQSVHFVVAAQH